MQKATDDFTVTTIYFDGQFWTAFIEKSTAGIRYSGRYVFGAEPTSPELRHWMLNGFTDVRLFRCDRPIKIKIQKEAAQQRSLSKSLDAYKEAQKEFLTQRKKETAAQKRAAVQQKYLDKQHKKKSR